MIGGRESLKRDSSGQLLIVSALAIALLISSTTVYVYELSKESDSSETPSIGDLLPALKQDTYNTMISAIANASNSGNKTTLTANLDRLAQTFRRMHSFEIIQLDFAVLNDSVYDLGTQLSWNASGSGISSAYASFTMKTYGLAATATVNYDINITTAVTISGFYVRVGDEKLVNLTCEVYNEGKLALTKRIDLFYEDFGKWVSVDSSNEPSTMDYGNGTYNLSFLSNVESDPVQVLINIYDMRDVFVQATITCYEG